MRRQQVIASACLWLVAAVLWPLAATAQQKPFRVGLISAVQPTSEMIDAFREGMRERGYIEGQNIVIDVRWPKPSLDQDPAAVEQTVNGNYDVIVAWATPTVNAVRRKTPTIPIVMVSVGDPVGSGFVKSLARPDANITGVSNVTNDLSAKIVELFAGFVPGMKRVGVVSNSYNQNVGVQRRETEATVPRFGLTATVLDARNPEEFERAFAAFAAERVDGVIPLSDPSVVEHSALIARLALAARLPTAFQRRENALAGGLFSYGGSIVNQYRYATYYVDRLLKGAKPADLPVEQPTRFDLVINLKTANLLGITVPPALLASANEVLD
jgi:ABC-type uncharacterized transport system substrate-binding protein